MMNPDMTAMTPGIQAMMKKDMGVKTRKKKKYTHTAVEKAAMKSKGY